jgi:hypothetical protein
MNVKVATSVVILFAASLVGCGSMDPYARHSTDKACRMVNGTTCKIEGAGCKKATCYDSRGGEHWAAARAAAGARGVVPFGDVPGSCECTEDSPGYWVPHDVSRSRAGHGDLFEENDIVDTSRPAN